MNILIIASHPGDGSFSMLRYADLLVRGYASSGHNVTKISPPTPVTSRIGIHSSLYKWCTYFERYLLFPFSIHRAISSHDIAHICDHIYAPLLPRRSRIPFILTCHDLIGVRGALGLIPEAKPRFTGRLLERWILRGMCRAKFVVWISTKTQSDWEDTIRKPLLLGKVIWNPLDAPMTAPMGTSPATTLQALDLPLDEPFFLHVGHNVWYKNRPGVLAIFAHLVASNHSPAQRLIIVGKPLIPSDEEFLARHNLLDSVYVVSKIDESSLQALYRGAAALLFPSLTEGFGWPILEAQANGCLVATSRREPMMGIAGAGAILLTVEDPALAAQEFLEGYSRRNEICQEGLLNLNRFNVGDAIASYLAFYQKVLSTFRNN